MPYEETWEEKGLYWKFTGEVTGYEVLRALLKRDMDCRFRGSRYLIVDFSSIDAFHMVDDEVVKVAEYDSELEGLAPGLKVAIVTEREAVFLKAAVYNQETVDTSWQVRIFSVIDDARQWVDQSETDAESS